MNTQRTPEKVTFRDLERAIASVKPEPSMYAPDEPQDHDDWRSAWTLHHSTRAAAWRTAFEWLNGLRDEDFQTEYGRGFRLIREKLS